MGSEHGPATQARMVAFFSPPLLMQDWNKLHTAHDGQERKASWTELFVDLVIVALCIKLSSFIKADLTWSTVGIASCVLFMSTRLWMVLTMHMNRISTDSLVSKFLIFVFSAGMTLMSVYVDHAALPAYFPAMVSFFAVSQLSVCVLNLIAIAHIPRVLSMFRFYVVVDCVSLAATVAASFLPAAAAFPAVAAVQALALLSYLFFRFLLCGRARVQQVPIHVELMAERDGLLVMLILGESVVSLVLPEEHDFAASFHIFVALAFLFVFCLHLMYYEVQPEHASEHAMRHSAATGRAFVLAHPVLVQGLFLVGVGLKILLVHLGDGALDPKYTWVVCAGTAITFATLSLVRRTHKHVRVLEATKQQQQQQHGSGNGGSAGLVGIRATVQRAGKSVRYVLDLAPLALPPLAPSALAVVAALACLSVVRVLLDLKFLRLDPVDLVRDVERALSGKTARGAAVAAEAGAKAKEEAEGEEGGGTAPAAAAPERVSKQTDGEDAGGEREEDGRGTAAPPVASAAVINAVGPASGGDAGSGGSPLEEEADCGDPVPAAAGSVAFEVQVGESAGGGWGEEGVGGGAPFAPASTAQGGGAAGQV